MPKIKFTAMKMKNLKPESKLVEYFDTEKKHGNSAVTDIDELFGEGYAKKHPELVGSYMQTAIFDCGTAVIANVSA